VPGEGTRVEKGSRVRLFVSTGPEQVSVPNVTGLSRDSAQDSLRGAGLEVSVREQAAAEPKDQVIAQDPAGGTRVDTGARVTITVSTGPEQVSVPDVRGLSPDAATRQLRAAGLKVVKRESPVTDEAQDGLVVDQSPDAGVKVDKDSSVVIFVGAFEETDTLQPQEPTSP
jgi:serine/threonine-protein kinase